jgi:hypothetical protein
MRRFGCGEMLKWVSLFGKKFCAQERSVERIYWIEKVVAV